MSEPLRLKGKDARIDAYIGKSADFARPVLNHLRQLVHAACPEVEEAMKWGFPHFMHKGILCSMAAFKHHCSFMLWKGALIFGKVEAQGRQEAGMGHFGRVTSLADLPEDKVLLGHLKKAVELNDAGTKKPSDRKKPSEKKKLIVPDCLVAALKKNAKAQAAFEKFSYSHKKEYVQWITEARRDETRERRVMQTIQWLAKGKSRNWKYENC